MSLRRIAMAASATLIVSAGFSSAAAHAKPFDDACSSASPNASVCIGAQKLSEAGGAECRKAGAPDTACDQTPAGHDVNAADLAAYQTSWVHRAAQLQYDLGNSVPLRDAQWLGTHNSFNTDSNGVTASHTDNNQQLTLTQQLDGDIREMELDVHYLPSTDNGASKAVYVCHGRGPDEYHAGCTTEPELKAVLPEITTWLNAHPKQVVMLYLEDNIDDDAGYAETVAAVDNALQRPDGSSLVYRPTAVPSGGCQTLPMSLTRDDITAAGAQVVLVGDCASGWASDVFNWNADEVESGSTPDFKPFPACDASYKPDVYANTLVRYYEDSTWLSAAIDPSETPADHDANALTPAKVTAMVGCGVNLFGFDQFEPQDGRVEASIWSWASGQPDAKAGDCAVQGANGRWSSASCDAKRPAACEAADGSWSITEAVERGDAADACKRLGATFSVPRTGQDNSKLRQAAGSAPEVLLNL